MIKSDVPLRSDAGHITSCRAEPLQRSGSEILNQSSRVAYFAVRPEERISKYSEVLERGLSKIASTKLLSSCVDGSKPFAEFGLSSRYIQLAVQVDQASGGVDLHFYDRPGITSKNTPFMDVDIMLLDDHLGHILHAIYRDGIIANNSAGKYHGKNLLVIKVLAQGMTDAAKNDKRILSTLTLLK